MAKQLRLCSGAEHRGSVALAYALGNGFITLDTSDFSIFIAKYGAMLKQARRIPQQLKSAEMALEPYAEFLD